MIVCCGACVPPAPRKPAFLHEFDELHFADRIRREESTLPKMGHKRRARYHERNACDASDELSLGEDLLGHDEERNCCDPEQIHDAGDK
jgi:hypothetical protein